MEDAARTVPLSALQLHSPLDSLSQAADDFGNLGRSLVNRRSDNPDGPHDVLEGRAFLHRVATAELVNTYFRGPLDLDNLTGETWEMRLAYRELMLKEPSVKAALISKVQAVAALDPQMLPDDPDRPADKAAAKFVNWSIERSYGGWPKLIENITLPALIDGFSVGEKGYDITRSAQYGGFWTLKKLYSLDTKWIRFDIDRFKEISRLRLIRTLPASALDPKDFVIFQHLQLFESPFGISDLRAAYRAAKFIESSIKLRAILLENFSGPFLKGMYPAGGQDVKQNMEAVLAKARSLGWVAAPVGSEIDVVNLATSAPDQFQQTIDDLRKEIYTAIRGAYLPFTEAGSGVQRADTGVQKSITEIFEWWLATSVCEVINRQVIPDLVKWNYGETVGLPRCQLGGMNLERASKQLDLIERVNKMTGNVSKRMVYDLSRVEQATDPDDRLPPDGQGQGAMPGGPPGPGAGPAMPPIAPDSANPQDAAMGPAASAAPPAQQFADAGTRRGSRLELTQEPSVGWPPAGDNEGRKLAAILDPSINATAKLIAEATASALHHSIPTYASNSLWEPEQRKAVIESLAATMALADMLARGRLHQNRPGVEVRKFADAGASAAFDLFGHSGDIPFSFIARPPRHPSNVENAIDYIRALVSIPGVDALHLADGWRRKAFTLALDTESILLDKVKHAVVGELVGGEDATATIQGILDAAGISPKNPQYAEMVARTNAMDAYNTGFHDTMRHPDVQDDFPVWQYCGIDDGRQGDDHDPQFNLYFPAADDFATVRGPRVYNCRCMPRPIYKTKWSKLQAGGAQIGPYPEWASAASAHFADIGSSALTPTNRLNSLLCVAADLRDEIRPERLRIILGHLADSTAAYAHAIGVPPPPSRVFHGVYDESKHPRDDHGQWVDKADLASARVNSGKAAELRSRVTKPAERAKLDAALGSNDPIATPPDRGKGKNLVAKARLGRATPQEQRDLFHHLPALSHEDLRDVRDHVEGQPSQQTGEAIDTRAKLADHVRAAAADGAAGMPEHPVFSAVKSEAAKSNLPAKKKAAYAARMDSVLRTMPAAAHDRIAANLQAVGFHGDASEVGGAAIGSALSRDYITDQERSKIDRYKAAFQKGKLKPAAAYVPKSGTLHVNGGTEATYAHILGHAIDGPNKEISSSPGWERAWHAELAGKLSEDPKLNRYSQLNQHEGFAEFSRLVYGTETPAAAIEAKFPLSSAVFKANGLWHDTPRFRERPPSVHEGEQNDQNSLDSGKTAVHGASTKPEELPEAKLPDVFGERLALDSDAGGAHVDTLAPTHNPATGTPANPENQHVYTVPTASLHVDPHLFQYKVAGIGAGGVTNKLSKVTKWDHNLGGVSLVWRDPDSGKDFIVNGHHRHELAERVGQKTLNVRYIQAKDSTEARSIGALANMAEGMGKAVDAAKWMRDTGKGIDYLKQAGVPVTAKMVQDAAALVNLSPKPFQAVTEGRLDEQTAVAVAKHLKDPDAQDALFQKIRARETAGNEWTPRQIETAAKKLATAGKTAAASGGDLFGDVPGEQSTFDQEVDLEDFANRKLAQAVTDYGAVGNKDRAGRVADAGNTLNLAENANRRKSAQDMQENFEKFARLKSNTSAAVKTAAAELAALGEHGSYVKKNAVRDKFYEQLKQAIADDLAGKPAPDDGRGGGTGGGAQSEAAGAGGGGASAGTDTAAGGVPAPAGTEDGAAVTPTEDAHAEEAQNRETGVSTLLGSQEPADAATESEPAAGADGVQRGVGADAETGSADGRGGSGSGPDSRADGGLAGTGQPATEEPVTTKFSGKDGEDDIATQTRAREQYDDFRKRYIDKGMATLSPDGTLDRVTLNTDEWRDLFPEYTGINSYAVHKASSYLNKKLFAEALKETAGKPNNTMIILAGGGGSGKGTAVKDYIDLAQYPLTLDQTSDEYEGLNAKLEMARKAGFKPQYVFIDRHPADAWTHGVVKRAVSSRSKGETARTVPLEVALKANIDARKTALELLQKNPDADATVIDNNHGFGKARMIVDREEAMKFLEGQIAAHDYEELHGRLERDTLDLHESGGLPDDIATGLVGSAAIHARRAQSGRTETERAGGPDGRGTAEDSARTGSEGGGTAGTGTGGDDDRSALADPKLRRHGENIISHEDSLKILTDAGMPKSVAAAAMKGHGTPANVKKAKELLGGKSVGKSKEAAAKDDAEPSPGRLVVKTAGGQTIPVPEDEIRQRIAERGKSETHPAEGEPTHGDDRFELGGGYEQVGQTDWHKHPKTGELVHAPTVKAKGNRKAKPAKESLKGKFVRDKELGDDGSVFHVTEDNGRVHIVGETAFDPKGAVNSSNRLRRNEMEVVDPNDHKHAIHPSRLTEQTSTDKPDEKPGHPAGAEAGAASAPKAEPAPKQAAVPQPGSADRPDAAAAGDSAGAADRGTAGDRTGENAATISGSPSHTVTNDSDSTLDAGGGQLAGGSAADSGSGRLPSGERLGADAAQASSPVLAVTGDGTGPSGESSRVPTSADIQRDGAGGKTRRKRNSARDGAGTGAGGTSTDTASGTGSTESVRTGKLGGGLDGSEPAIPHPTVSEKSIEQLPTPENPTDLAAGNFRYEDRDFVPHGLKSKFNANIAAIRTLRTIEAEGRDRATPEEQAILSKFSGWGQFKAVFNTYNASRYGRVDKWEKERQVLQGLLSDDEWKAAREATLNSHYTHPSIVDAHWKIAERLGFKGGRFLETSAGIGYYLGMMPPHIAGRTHATAVELDNTSGGILGKLYPAANVQVQGFEEHKAPDHFYDLVASNVPFGNYGVHDPKYNRHKALIHDYFFLKSIDKVRPGGLVMHVTSAGTLDKPDSKIREELHKKGAELVAAIRFPNGAHKENAGTEVVTDMLIFRKRLPDEAPSAANWLRTTTVPDPDGGEPIPVNQYFADNPQQVLGQLDRSGKLYRADSVGVSLPGDAIARRIKAQMAKENRLEYTPEEEAEIETAIANSKPQYEAALQAAIDRIPADVLKPYSTDKKLYTPESHPAPGDTKEGGFVIHNGKLHIAEQGQLVPHEAKDGKAFQRIEGMLSVRDALRAVVNDEMSGNDASASRAKLNAAYDAFVKKHGYLNAKANKRAFRTDPDSPRLLALEEYDHEKGTGKKAAVFERDTIGRIGAVEKVGTVDEGLGVSLHEHGAVHIGRIAKLTGMPEATIESHLVEKGLAFQDPSEGWKPADHYLSGNVRRKLAMAKAAAAADPKFAPNVAALEKVQPEDIPHTDIGVKLGAPWIPTTDIAQFAADLTGGQPDHFEVGYVNKNAHWMAHYSSAGGRTIRSSEAAQTQWGTERVNFIQLLDAALNNRQVVVYDKDSDGNKYVNEEATKACELKTKDIKDRFKQWVWQDDDRRERLHRHYNDNYNNIRVQQYDGRHLKMPGMRADYALHPHIRNFIWQVVSNGSAFAGHEVGTGKTNCMVGSAMELRRLGLARKPAIACKKSNIEQITREALDLYPGIKILSTADMFDKENRRKALSQIATGDYDLVVLTHDHLDKMKMKPEVQRKYIEEEIADIDEAIAQAKADDPRKGNRIVTELENMRKNREEALKNALDETHKDDTLYFEETGIDHLFVDEAHRYKTLPCYTKQQGLKGVPRGRSQRATNMLMRTRWLQENNGGRGVVFATGTPVANTLAELYNMQRFIQPQALKDRGIEHFDSWCSVFADTDTKTEFSVSGEYKPVTRLAKYTNFPELKQMTGVDIDIQRADDLIRRDPAGNPILDDKGQPIKVIKRPERQDYKQVSPKTKEMRALMASLQKRAREVKARKGPPQKGDDNMLKICTDGRKGAIDMRLLDASAADNPDSKTNKMIRNVLQIAKENPGKTQMIFSDVGVNPVASGFHLYADIIQKLVDGGIPRDKIADFSKLEGAKKEDATHKLKRGELWVAIGGTDKLGTGVNAQDNLLALHHLDVPWLPSAIEQRDGRGWRHGNKNKKIHIHRYVAEGSLDQTFWQIIGNKAKFIKQAMTPNSKMGQREFEDTDVSQISPEQFQAAASGNPHLMEKIDTERQLNDLKHAERQHDLDQFRYKDGIRSIDRSMNVLKAQKEAFETDGAILDQNPDFKFVIGDVAHDDRKEAGEALTQAFESVLDPYKYGEYLGEYRGLPVYKVGENLAIKSQSESDQAGDSSYNHGNYYMTGQPTLASLEAIARRIKDRAADAGKAIAAKEADKKRMQAEVGKVFPKAEELKAKQARFNELDALLMKGTLPDGYSEGDDVELMDGRRVKIKTVTGPNKISVEHEGKEITITADDLPPVDADRLGGLKDREDEEDLTDEFARNDDEDDDDKPKKKKPEIE